MAPECVDCGKVGQPCCTPQNTAPGLKGNPCETSVCINDTCTVSKGTWHQACVPGSVPCSTDFNGLKCIANPGTPGAYWCDCSTDSDGKACTPNSVCGAQS